MSGSLLGDSAQTAASSALGSELAGYSIRGFRMSAYPYATHLDILLPALTRIDLDPIVAGVRDQWWNQTLCKVNDSVVRLGVMQGEYHWHKHDNDDEFFYVVDGRFLIDLEPSVDDTPGRVIELTPRQGFVVPKGVVHRTRAPERSVILMVENAGIIPTGD
jgi:mannose-6-phosphate isomerase-like protein (cupin superfamily)